MKFRLGSQFIINEQGFQDHTSFKSPLNQIDELNDFEERALYFRKIKEGNPWLHRVRLDITRACIFRCDFCFSSLGDFIPKKFDQYSIPLKHIETLSEQFEKLQVRVLNLYGGGEPTLHPQFYDVLKIFSKGNLKIRIISNGVGLINGCGKALFDFRKNIDIIRFSIPGVSEQTHQKITGTSSFRGIVNKIDELMRQYETTEKRPEIGIYVPVVYNYRKTELQNFLEIINKMKVDWILFREDTRIPSDTTNLSNSFHQSFPEVKENLELLADDFPDLPIYHYAPVATPNLARKCYYQLSDIALSYDTIGDKLIMVSCEHHIPMKISEFPAEGTFTHIQPDSLFETWKEKLKLLLSNPPPCTRPDHCYAYGHNLKLDRFMEQKQDIF